MKHRHGRKNEHRRWLGKIVWYRLVRGGERRWRLRSVRVYAANLDHAAFEIVAPEIVRCAERWFTKFDTIPAAFEALRSNTVRGADHVTDARPDSPIYEVIMSELAELQRRAG